MGNGTNINKLTKIRKYLLAVDQVLETVEGAESRAYKKQKLPSNTQV